MMTMIASFFCNVNAQIFTGTYMKNRLSDKNVLNYYAQRFAKR